MNWYKKVGSDYELTEDMSIYLRDFNCLPDIDHQYFYMRNGWLVIKAGYRWNGINYFPTTKRNIRGSLFHDCLYQIMQLGILPSLWQYDSDRVFDKIMKEDKECGLYRNFLYYGVRVFGEFWL